MKVRKWSTVLLAFLTLLIATGSAERPYTDFLTENNLDTITLRYDELQDWLDMSFEFGKQAMQNANSYNQSVLDGETLDQRQGTWNEACDRAQSVIKAKAKDIPLRNRLNRDIHAVIPHHLNEKTSAYFESENMLWECDFLEKIIGAN
ncbi:MAG: hypothetical protein OXG24_02250 [Gammaproteobacteria bacterium]|nr:hypothetical protein [Gammaproteobacteria bacterium]